MIALIDGDVVVYRTGFASEDTDEAIACVRANKTIEDILEAVNATSYEVWFSDTLTNNFRYHIDNNYKASRQKQPKPKHYKALKMFLTQEWGAKVTEGQEADDILGIKQSEEVDYCQRRKENGRYDMDPIYCSETVICSTDKDLLQVPGNHWNFVRKEHKEISQTQGLRFFYSQLLIGDRVDDIEGIYGIGPVKAEKLLKDAITEEELFEVVQKEYKDDERLLKNARLLWVRRRVGELWTCPSGFNSVDAVCEAAEDPVLDEGTIQDQSGEHSDSILGESHGESSASGGLLLR